MVSKKFFADTLAFFKCFFLGFVYPHMPTKINVCLVQLKWLMWDQFVSAYHICMQLCLGLSAIKLIEMLRGIKMKKGKSLKFFLCYSFYNSTIIWHRIVNVGVNCTCLTNIFLFLFLSYAGDKMNKIFLYIFVCFSYLLWVCSLFRPSPTKLLSYYTSH